MKKRTFNFKKSESLYVWKKSERLAFCLEDTNLILNLPYKTKQFKIELLTKAPEDLNNFIKISLSSCCSFRYSPYIAVNSIPYGIFETTWRTLKRMELTDFWVRVVESN